MKRETSVKYRLNYEDIVALIRTNVAAEEGVGVERVEVTLDAKSLGMGPFTSTKPFVAAEATILTEGEAAEKTKRALLPLQGR